MASSPGTRTADVVVVGSGINALSADAVLTRGGRSVVVLEREERLGGAVHTQDDLPAPGWTTDVFSCWHPLFVGGPVYPLLAEELTGGGWSTATPTCRSRATAWQACSAVPRRRPRRRPTVTASCGTDCAETMSGRGSARSTELPPQGRSTSGASPRTASWRGTRRATVAVQAVLGVTRDGVVGPITRDGLAGLLDG